MLGAYSGEVILHDSIPFYYAGMRSCGECGITFCTGYGKWNIHFQGVTFLQFRSAGFTDELGGVCFPVFFEGE